VGLHRPSHEPRDAGEIRGVHLQILLARHGEHRHGDPREVRGRVVGQELARPLGVDPPAADAGDVRGGGADLPVVLRHLLLHGGAHDPEEDPDGCRQRGPDLARLPLEQVRARRGGPTDEGHPRGDLLPCRQGGHDECTLAVPDGDHPLRVHLRLGAQGRQGGGGVVDVVPESGGEPVARALAHAALVVAQGGEARARQRLGELASHPDRELRVVRVAVHRAGAGHDQGAGMRAGAVRHGQRPGEFLSSAPEVQGFVHRMSS